jgi:hypothetical protein
LPESHESVKSGFKRISDSVWLFEFVHPAKNIARVMHEARVSPRLANPEDWVLSQSVAVTMLSISWSLTAAEFSN